MENIILTNNKDLRLVGVKVGVLSTLRFELPLVSASATHVEVIVTSGDVHSAYTATFIDDTKRWQCDIAASQFPAVGKQSYEVAYVLDGKQFWDGKGWIEIEDATTSGIEPQPRPEPYRYAVVSVNGYGADAQGAVRIPKTVIATDSPTTTEGYMEGDIYFNRETGATWTLCNVQGTLTWVFNYKDYYTKAETDEAIDRVAAYYITYDAAGNPFPTYAALANATTVYSGGKVRIPTRNDYCVVLADETHQGAEYRYIYAVAEGQTTGSWQPQFPVGGVMTVDQTVIKNSQNPVSGGGVWSAIWGALSALPAGFASLYDWVVDQLAGKMPSTATGADIAVSGTDSTKISAALAGKQSALSAQQLANIAAVSDALAFDATHSYAEGDPVVYNGTLYTFTAAHTGAWTGSDVSAVDIIARLAGKADDNAVVHLTGNETIDGTKTFTGGVISDTDGTPLDTTSGLQVGIAGRQNKIRIWQDLTSGNLMFYRLGSWEIVTLKMVNGETIAFAAANPTAGNLAALDANGNPTDSGIKPSDKLDSTSAAPAFSTSSTYAVGEHVTYNGKLYKCTTAVTTAGAWDASAWAADTMTDPDAVLDITAQNQLRVVAKDGTLLWAQGYDLASTSSATLACDATNNFTFADGATTQAFTLPTAPTGKVGDFGLDIDNSANKGAATISFTNITNNTASVVIPKGENLNDMLSIAAGELARFYISLSTFRVNNLPTWHIVKQVVENGGAQS